ncbi:nuclear transport factor 2 family protein [Mycobacterium colombiense]|uniref:SnoaL-like domain-containing protein n=1 Tax=Mycobacterium colombiense TaxID=339268 RepID=A0A1A2YVF2_9MYCO|nr:nuclear transport factor 2 family protein [Mycobacterium colombiense]OBI41232.1 hypothetical protein A5708_02180 [Mycobacterium colombiense]
MTLSADQRAALSDLVHRYAASVDDREFEFVASLFAADAELAVPAPPADLLPIHSHRGRDAITAAVAAVAAVARTEHAIIGEVYDAAAQPGTARGRITCVAHHWSERGGELVDVAWHLRYDDQYVLTDAGWRISRRTLTVHAIETRPVRRLLPHDPA